MLIRLSTIWVVIFIVALLSSDIMNDETRLYIDESSQSTSLLQFSSPDLVELKNDKDYHHDSLSRINLPQAFLFNHEHQNTPSYFLISEGIVKKLAPRFFKNLVNPPKALPWYIELSSNPSSARVSGWKDGNSLYTASLTYHA